MSLPNKAESRSPELDAELRVDGLRLRNRVYLAPMSGVTDAPFRRLAWKFGAGMVVSEMVASEALVGGHPEMALKASDAGLPLNAIQIAGREAKWMRLAARMAEDSGADLVDINMGCPSKRVTTGLSGSALMRDLDHALTLIKAVVGEVSIPVTLKMRLGWDDTSINAPELASRAEQAGVSMITVHARTRCQFYKGKADWAAVRAVREATRLPLVVNGDIVSGESARNALARSGADAVMIGRASYGTPWLAGDIAAGGSVVCRPNLGDIVSAHYEEMLSHYGIAAGVRQARKHLGWYLEKLDDSPPVSLRREMMTADNPAAAMRAILAAFGPGETRRAA